MRRAAIDNLYRKITDVNPPIQAVIYFPDAFGGGGFLPDGTHLMADQLQEMIAGDHVLTVQLSAGLHDNSGPIKR